jgi:hypothetical protein
LAYYPPGSTPRKKEQRDTGVGFNSSFFLN